MELELEMLIITQWMNPAIKGHLLFDFKHYDVLDMVEL
jgi:hypothetical protein